jgi:hypothetical protein
MSKVAPHHVSKTVQGWVPVSQAAREFHAKTKLGQVVDMRGKRPRHPKHHRKLFALLGIIVENTELFANADDALIGLKAITGHGHWGDVRAGSRVKDVFYPASINFESMAQDEFEAFYDKAIAAVQRWWLPVADEELRAAVEEFAA